MRDRIAAVASRLGACLKLRQFAIAIALLSILVASPRLAAAESTRAWSGDERIAQRVSIIAEGISIDEFLQQLSSKVGIKLKVNPELADDKVVILSLIHI